MEKPEKDPYCTYLNGKKLDKEPEPRDPQETRHTVLKVLFWAAVVLLIAGLTWHFAKPYITPGPDPQPRPTLPPVVTEEPEETEATEETEDPDDPDSLFFPQGETFEGVDVHVTIDSIEVDPEGDPNSPPEEGSRLIRCHVTAENVSQTTQKISTIYFYCFTGEEISDSSYQEDYLYGEDRLDEALAPGETGGGWLWFQVRKDYTHFLIKYYSDAPDDPTIGFTMDI